MSVNSNPLQVAHSLRSLYGASVSPPTRGQSSELQQAQALFFPNQSEDPRPSGLISVFLALSNLLRSELRRNLFATRELAGEFASDLWLASQSDHNLLCEVGPSGL
jgi:hypothetical protein